MFWGEFYCDYCRGNRKNHPPGIEEQANREMNMSMKPYDYKHREGRKKITWKTFGNLTRRLSELLAKKNIDIIIGIARAGLLPATTVSCMLGKEMYPVRLTRRYHDTIVRETPEWKVRIPPSVLEGKTIVIIDEITDTGTTLAMAKAEAEKCTPRLVFTATLITHSWADPKPDYYVQETDALVLFPWDYHIYKEGKWIIHPEYKAAMAATTGKK
jgi:uncharacterized protein